RRSTQICRIKKKMGLITKHLKIEGDKGDCEVETLFDTGATYSFIRKDKAEAIATILSLRHPKSFELAREGQTVTVTECTRIDIRLNGVTISDEVVVMEDLSEELILGASTMQKWRIKLDLEKEDVVVDERVARLKLV
ncbi:MAG: retropepsin-like aspartic protease, partial [bacterium]|nr:retropepsin-like aspartic protease [bacterium]